jgi:DNA replication protein DnaC
MYKKYTINYNLLNYQYGGKYKCNPTMNFLDKMCKDDINGEYNTMDDCITKCFDKRRLLISNDIIVQGLGSINYFPRSLQLSSNPLVSRNINDFSIPTQSVISTDECTEIMNYLNTLPDAISNPNYILKEKCLTVPQQYAAITDKTDKYTILSTFGLGPCHCLIIYNTVSHYGFLAHIDSLNKLNLLNKIFTYLKINNKDDVKIYISGGENNTDLTCEIYKKLKVLNLHDRIIGTHLHERKIYTSISLNTITGDIGIALCSDYLSMKIPDYNMKYTELHKFYGFDQYKMSEQTTWYNTINDSLESLHVSQLEIDTVGNITQESINNTFETYNAVSSKEKELLSIAKKFAKKITEQKVEDGPIFLCINGVPGIGKTHISVSIAKHVKSHGKKVIFINAKKISEEYQQSMISSKQNIDLNKWITDYDLIIVDDLNTEYGITNDFMKKAFEYVYFHSKALLITSNIYISTLPDLFHEGFDTHSFLILRTPILDSKRTPWISSIVNIQTDKEKMKLLVDHSTNQGACMVFTNTSHSPNLDEYITLYKSFVSDDIKEQIKIYKARSPYKNDYVDDFYVHTAEEYNVVVIKVSITDEVEQLLHLIHKAHNYGIKCIIVTTSIYDLSQLLIEVLDSYSLKNEKPRLTERVNLLLPGILKYKE